MKKLIYIDSSQEQDFSLCNLSLGRLGQYKEQNRTLQCSEHEDKPAHAGQEN